MESVPVQIENATETIVVGHDGSADAAEAVVYAFELAERLHARLLVIRAWTIDTAPHGTLVSGGYVSSFDETSEKITEILRQETQQIAARHPSVEVEFRSQLGQPASVLIAASVGAALLVVGCRGRGGFVTLMLGSVSEQCTHHAHCPVLVVRPRSSDGSVS
jgi:nucleotide-binding universal stress UspA family protein